MPPFRKITEYYREKQPGWIPLPMTEKEPPQDLPQWASDEWARLWQMWQNQRNNLTNPFPVIAGADEVGRGPVAGPVVACAAVFTQPLFLPGLYDSKKVPENLRDILAALIGANSSAVFIGAVSAEEIDRVNILNASLAAMKKAVLGLRIRPGLVLVDGNREIPTLGIPQKTIIKGDGTHYSIAAASIAAKVFRDRLMDGMDRRYEGYGFAGHKGYCTAFHAEAIKRLGPCPIHRKTFAPVRDFICPSEQLTLL